MLSIPSLINNHCNTNFPSRFRVFSLREGK
nr:MAG TPA: hypothetical protein [Caudoviricetes sp.]